MKNSSKKLVKQANISENDTVFRTSGCGSICIKVVPPDPKILKSWQPDLHAWMTDAFQINWAHLKAYAFPPFALIGRVLAKTMTGKCTLIIITPVWLTQPWHTPLLRMCIQVPIFIPPFPNRLTDPNQTQHPL